MKLVAITLALTGLGFGSWGLCSGTAASAPCASECDATVTTSESSPSRSVIWRLMFDRLKVAVARGRPLGLSEAVSGNGSQTHGVGWQDPRSCTIQRPFCE